jgi:hypothetical protein
MQQMAQDRWTRSQQLIALRLYMRLPFGRLHGKNAEIVELAARIGRTPSALAMKACNFASLDPTFRRTNRTGLSGASNADRAIWSEFTANPERCAMEMEDTYARVEPSEAAEQVEAIELPDGETETTRTVRTRRVQSFFRAAVLTSYAGRCAISGLAVPELLNASHIIPWSQNVERRADPTNGICLNALFDRAFDRGFIAVDDDLRILVSNQLPLSNQPTDLRCSLDELDGRKLAIPSRFAPDASALEYHRQHVFRR